MSHVDPVRGARNLADLVRLAALSRPDDPALVAGERTVSWRELDTAVASFASGLLRQGLVAGDRVALSLRNGPAFVVSYFGALRAGLVVVPLNTGSTEAELSAMFAQATPRLVVAEAATAARVREAVGDTARVVVAGEASYDAIGHSGSRADAPPPPDPSHLDPESLAVLLFTAGTAGRPKAAMLSHRAMLANIGQLQRLEPPALGPDDVVLVVLPLFHVYALNAVLGQAAAVGACCVLVDRFDPEETLALIARHGVTNVPGAPPMYVAWSRRPDLEERLAGVRPGVRRGAAVARGPRADGRALGRPCGEGYGMTEAAPVVATHAVQPVGPSPAAWGSRCPACRCGSSTRTGGWPPTATPATSSCGAPNLFSGYWPDGAGGPDADGWWRTGDVAYADDDGDLHLVDRRRDLVLVSGFNVYPFEVETVLASHPDVAEAAVIGVPDEVAGSAVKAFLVPLPGHDLVVDEVLAHAATRLARFKCPTLVEVVPGLPHSSTGKVIRARLRGAALDA